MIGRTSCVGCVEEVDATKFVKCCARDGIESSWKRFCTVVGNISSKFWAGIMSVTKAEAKSSSGKMSLSIEQIPETLINLKPYF